MLTLPILLAAAVGLVDSVGFWAAALILICGIVALAYIGMRQLKVQPPGWVVEVFWVLAVCVAIVAAIIFLVSLAGGQPGLWFGGR